MELDDVVAPEAIERAAASIGGAAAGAGAPRSTSAAHSGVMKPSFPELTAVAVAGGREEMRSIRVPPHRYTPLKEQWDAIVKPIVEHMKLQIRMNTKLRAVEIKTSPATTEIGALQKAEDFVRGFMLGFDVADAIALLRLDDLYIETFEVTDVKPLKGDHLSRAIGRIAGVGGKTRHAIENATRTRIVVADQKVARDAVCSLILGSPPGKVYNQMRQVAARVQQK